MHAEALDEMSLLVPLLIHTGLKTGIRPGSAGECGVRHLEHWTMAAEHHVLPKIVDLNAISVGDHHPFTFQLSFFFDCSILTFCKHLLLCALNLLKSLFTWHNRYK